MTLLHFLVCLWPPWPVSQPEDEVKPLAWRAIEITADGRYFLRAVFTPGRDPWDRSGEDFQTTAEVDIQTPLPAARNVRPGRRLVILPPPR